jgi:hypothetical protein
MRNVVRIYWLTPSLAGTRSDASASGVSVVISRAFWNWDWAQPGSRSQVSYGTVRRDEAALDLLAVLPAATIVGAKR